MPRGVPPPKIVAGNDGEGADRRDKRMPRPPPSPSAISRQGQTAETRPCFASSWIENCGVNEEEVAARYEIGGVRVTILSPPLSSCGLYAVDPPEYRLNPVHIQVLAAAIDHVTRSMPADLELTSMSAVRPHVKARAKDFIFAQLASRSPGDIVGTDLEKEAERLSEVLCRYTTGYGVLETLLNDPLIQDIYIDAPSSQTPVQVVLRSSAGENVRQKCRTNVFVGKRDLQGLVSRVKFETGLPFSESHPILEADMKRLGARVTLVGPPLSDKGVSVAIRKHSESMWTMPMLVANGSLSPLLSAFLWASVIGRRTVLIAGSRGAGKTTLLGAMLLEFPLSQRIVLIEDTPEIPVARMQALGYDVQALRFSEGGGERSTDAEEALRVSLRLGESAIVIGEVRGREARVLYESMRAGSAGSAVLGTIHGNSAKGVLDRATEDLGVSERAFSSTDLVVVIGLVRSPDGTRFSRQVIQVSEVRMAGKGIELVDLFMLEPGCACAKPTESFTDGCKTIRGISAALGITPSFAMDVIRAKAYADQSSSEDCHGKPSCPDAFRVKSNEVLTKYLFGPAGPEEGLKAWRRWLDAV